MEAMFVYATLQEFDSGLSPRAGAVSDGSGAAVQAVDLQERGAL